MPAVQTVRPSLRLLALLDPQTARDPALALRCAADTIVVDMASQSTPDMIAATIGWLGALLAFSPRQKVYVRIPSLAGTDPGAILDRSVAAGVDGVMLPGAVGGQDVTLLDARISVAEAVHGRPDAQIRIVAEAADTARAVFGLASYRGATHRLDGLVWSASTLAADLGGITPTDGDGRLRPPLAAARAHLILAAGAAGVTAIEMLGDGPSPADI
eukprot:gene28122-31272_t